MLRSGTKARVRGRTAAAMVMAAAAGVLTACQPPPPDGRDLGITVHFAAGVVTAGVEQLFSVEVTNHGATATTATTLAVQAPTNLQVTAAAPAGAACPSAALDPVSTLVACPIGALGPGQTRSVLVHLTGAAPAAVADVTIAVSSDGSEPANDFRPNRRVLPLTVLDPDDAHLHLIALEGPAPTGGQAFVSAAYVANRGPGTAAPVTVTQRFPPSVAALDARFEQLDGPLAGSCTTEPGAVTCTSGPHTVAIGDAWNMLLTLDPGDAEPFPIAMEASAPQSRGTDHDFPPAILATHRPDTQSLFQLWPVPLVAPGTEVNVRSFGVAFGDVQGLNADLPPGFELRSVTADGLVYPCVGTGAFSCPLPGVTLPFSQQSDVAGVSFQFRVLAGSPPAPATITIVTPSGQTTQRFFLGTAGAS